MSYSKHTWADGPDGLTPITAAELNHMEDGILDAVSPEELTEAVNVLVAQDTVMAADLVTISAQLGPIGVGLLAAQATLNTATRLPTALALVLRDASGRFQAASPAAGSDVGTKQYIDTAIVSYVDAAIAGVVTTVDYTNIPAGSTITVLKAGTWPARPTARADIVVAWKGADPSPSVVSSGTGGMRDGIDYRLVTP